MLDKLRRQCSLLKETNPEKYQVIEEILRNDNAFLEMDVDMSLSILRDLGIKEQDLNNVYLHLIKI